MLQAISRSNAALILLAVLAIISLSRGVINAQHNSQDFRWRTSRDLLLGQNPYSSHSVSLSTAWPRSAQAPGEMPLYPASVLPLLWPYAAVPEETARTYWAFSNIVFTLILLVGLYKFLGKGLSARMFMLVSLLMFISTPLRVLIGNGQHTMFSMAFFVLSLVFSKYNRYAAGICLGISWMKYTVTFPLTLFYVARGRLDLIVIGTCFHLVMFVFCSYWVDAPIYELLSTPVRVAMENVVADGRLDLVALAARLGVASKSYPIMAAILLMLAVGGLCLRRECKDDVLLLSALAMLTLLVVYHRTYDFVLLIIPLFFIAREAKVGALSIGFCLCIGASWFVERGLDWLVASWSTAFVRGLNEAYWVALVLLFYGTFGFALWRIARQPRKVGVLDGAVGR